MYKQDINLFQKFFVIALCVLMICCTVDCMIVFLSRVEEKAQDTVSVQVLPILIPVETEIATIQKDVPEPIDWNPYNEICLTDDEKELLARMAYSEARGQEFDGQVAVIQVALNRYMHHAYSGSISEILLAPNQFAVGTNYGEEQMAAVEAALAGNPVLDLNTDVVYFSTGSLTYGSYYKTIGDHVFRTYM